MMLVSQQFFFCMHIFYLNIIERSNYCRSTELIEFHLNSIVNQIEIDLCVAKLPEVYPIAYVLYEVFGSKHQYSNEYKNKRWRLKDFGCIPFVMSILIKSHPAQKPYTSRIVCINNANIPMDSIGANI